MLEILTFYVSGFWIWLGITVGLGMIVEALSSLIYVLIKGK